MKRKKYRLKKDNQKTTLNRPQRDEKYSVLEDLYARAIAEYEYSLEVNGKIDSKVNLMLTFGGVLFIFIINLLNLKTIISFENTEIPLGFWAVVYTILVVVVFLSYAYALTTLISLCRTNSYLHINIVRAYNIKDKLISKEVTIHYFLQLAIASTVKNNDVNEDRAKKVGRAAIALVIVLSTAVIAKFLEYNLL